MDDSTLIMFEVLAGDRSASVDPRGNWTWTHSNTWHNHSRPYASVMYDRRSMFGKFVWGSRFHARRF